MKIIKWVLAAFFFLFIAVITVPFILGNRITPLIISGVNSKISTAVSFDKSELNLLRSFPRISLRFTNLTVLSSPLFEKNQFAYNCDTLLSCKSASLEMNLTSLMKGNYSIQRVVLKDGFVILCTDKDGKVNYEVNKEVSEEAGNFNLEIKQLNVSDFNIYYDNLAKEIRSDGTVKNSKIRSRIKNSTVDFECKAAIDLQSIGVNNIIINNSLPASLDLLIHQSDSGLVIKNGVVIIPGLAFAVEGSVLNNGFTDIRASATGDDIARLLKIIPGKYTSKLSGYRFEGQVSSTVKIKGYSGKTVSPSIEALFSINKGSVRANRSLLEATGIELSGSLVSNTGNLSDSKISVSLLNAEVGSASVSALLDISGLTDPEVTAAFTGDVFPEEIREFLNIAAIKEASGSARVNLTLSGKPGKDFRFNIPSFLKLAPEGTVSFSSFAITPDSGNVSLKDITGNVMFSNTLWADNLALTLNGNRISTSGSFAGFRDWLSGIPSTVRIDAELYAEMLDPGKLISAGKPDNKEKSKRAYVLPGGTVFNVRLRNDHFSFNDFSADNLEAEVIYRPGKLTVRSLNMNTMDGVISGNCTLYQNPDNSFVARGDLSAENVDINKAFIGFRNFRQEFIKAENLQGKLTGNLSFMLPLDSLLSPATAELTAEGKFKITDGVLRDFEPVKELSGFIELSELQNIEFSELENEFYIRNNYLALPRMEIRSSAADFSVSGRHSFENSYEYHLSVWLSEILSRKARKTEKYNTEFGAIEDDGLGRSKIFLKITGSAGKTKVAYDLKAATGKIRESLKNEKGNLKSILREEYGLFSNDTASVSKSAPKPKFRIEWSESDITDQKADTVKTEKERGINRIFKKKKI